MLPRSSGSKPARTVRSRAREAQPGHGISFARRGAARYPMAVADSRAGRRPRLLRRLGRQGRPAAGAGITATFLRWTFLRAVFHRGYVLASGLYFVVARSEE